MAIFILCCSIKFQSDRDSRKITHLWSFHNINHREREHELPWTMGWLLWATFMLTPLSCDLHSPTLSCLWFASIPHSFSPSLYILIHLSPPFFTLHSKKRWQHNFSFFLFKNKNLQFRAMKRSVCVAVFLGILLFGPVFISGRHIGRTKHSKKSLLDLFRLYPL